MSSQQETKQNPGDSQHHLESQGNPNKERHDEGNHNNSMDHRHPHPVHHSQHKPILPPRHDVHYPDDDELPGHIKSSNKMTKKGTE